MDYKVILAQRGIAGGADIFSMNLASGLLQRGISARILLTHRPWNPTLSFPVHGHIPTDRLPVERHDGWPARWRTMIRYLESQAPCIYIPNYDLEYSCVSPKLSRRIVILGIVHSDDAMHYEHILRMGAYWNGIVAVSKTILEEISSFPCGFAPRSTLIHYGVEMPSAVVRSHEGPLRMIYVGRLIQHQKRVLDLPPIFEKVTELCPDASITVVGDGPQRVELTNICQNLVSKGIVRFLGVLPNQEVLTQLENHDVILLTSDFEGMPICILEAMGRGCIPIVTSIRSGVPELIQNEKNGFIVPIGDIDGFARRLKLLNENRELRQCLSNQAYETVNDRFSVDRMVDDYIALFERLKVETSDGIFHRPDGKIPYPPWMKISWKDYLPGLARRAASNAKKLFVTPASRRKNF